MLQKKKQIMMLWSNCLELQLQAAIAAETGLLNAEALRDAIYCARYGEERWLRRKSQAEIFSEAAE